MININDTTVAVETSAELKTVLEGNNKITHIYLAQDITLATGITILATKTQVTIDGLYPTDGTGTFHTYTDMNSASAADAIGIRSASSIHVTVQNLNVIGRNYYGIIYVPDSSTYQNVKITYKNLTYNGPQITYHPYGLSVYQDVNINIISVSGTASPVNEVGEVGSVQIGGKSTISHNAPSDSAFWFRGSSPYIEILEDADVSIITTRDIVYSSNYVAITVHKNAIFSVKTAYGFFRSNSHQASSISVNENSSFSVIQTQTNGTNACLSCRGAFTVSKGASVYLEANYQNSAPLVLFNTSSSSFKIDRPKNIIFYNKTYNCLSFGNTSAFNIDCGKIDYWSTSPTLISTGILENNPLYTWHKSDENDISLAASVTSSKTTISSNNLTEAEIAKLPSLDLLTFQTAKTLRFVELGSLDLKNAPSIIEFERPIINDELKLLGRKDETLAMSVVDTRAISTDWYLYAYIDSPLTTPDGKHSLPGSLVYVDENNDIKTLSENPTLIFSGTANSGTTKTTEISWVEENGILFKVIEPLYNGETYSTEINWILSSEKLN